MIISLAGFYSAAHANEVIGVLPLKNLRHTHDNDWLGYYIQARVTANLKKNSTWSFLNFNTLSMGYYKNNRTPPKHKDITVLITGSFQSVLRYGKLVIVAEKFSKNKRDFKKYSTEFQINELEDKIDEITYSIGRWIKPGFKPRSQFLFPSHQAKRTKLIYKLKEILFQPQIPIEPQLVLHLMNLITSKSPREFIADFVEGMLIYTQDLEDQEQILTLKKLEVLLKNSIKKYQTDSRLYSLLAEVYYFMRNYPSWIIKTSKDALMYDKRNDLALLMLTIASGYDSEEGEQSLKKLANINPWIWTKSSSDEINFQKGILKKEFITHWGFWKQASQ